jgi:hypothetical protein
MAIWNILWIVEIFLTIWRILSSFGAFFPVLVSCTKKNLATLVNTGMRVLSNEQTFQTQSFLFRAKRLFEVLDICVASSKGKQDRPFAL